MKLLFNKFTNKIYRLPILVLMPHSSCNCRCVMCDIWKANQSKSEISTETLEKHLGSFRKLKVKEVALSGGEALMHSNLWRFCSLLKSQNIRITLLSTGLLLKQNAQQIIDHIDEVIVSLDGSAEVHNEIRNVPNAYQKLMVGVQTLKELQPDFPVKGRSVLQKKNFRDFYGIINSAKEIGLDQISFLGADVSTEAFNRAQQWDATKVSSIALGDEEVAEFQTLLHKSFIDFKSDYDSKFIAESHTKMLTIAQHYGGLLGKVEFPNKRCNAPWVSAVIEADGDVRPCFFYPSYGNLNQHDFPTLLNSEPAIAFRKQLDIAKNPICQRCVCSLYVSPLKF